MDKKSLILLAVTALIILVIVLWASGMDDGEDFTFETNTDSNVVKTWRVTKSTGLYDSIDPDANMIESLSVGTRVRSTRSSGNLTCLINNEGMELCRVEVVGDGSEGWILKKWLD